MMATAKKTPTRKKAAKTTKSGRPRKKPGPKKGAPNAGRPFKLTVDDDLCQRVEQMARQALTVKQIAGCLSIHPDVLLRYFKRHAELKSAYENGRAEGKHKATGVLYRAIEEGNLTATIFYLKTQAGWNDRKSVEVTGAGGGSVQHDHREVSEHDKRNPSNMTDEELEAALAEVESDE